MDLADIKARLQSIEEEVGRQPIVYFGSFERSGRSLHLGITERFVRAARKSRLWLSKGVLSAIRNAGYGFEEEHARSLGGADGIFLLDRTFRPANEMMRKIFTRYLDHPESGAAGVAAELGCRLEELVAVRVVSHDLRLLGVMRRTATEDWIVLVDLDRES
jgi:hypothetical protein